MSFAVLGSTLNYLTSLGYVPREVRSARIANWTRRRMLRDAARLLDFISARKTRVCLPLGAGIVQVT
jgi:hypothetical protein